MADVLKNIIEEQDRKRIAAGIETAIETLQQLPAERRGMKALSNYTTELMAVFEAMCCVPYHRSKPKPLMDVLALLQSTKVLRLSCYVPAHARWLFEDDEHLRKFATVGFTKTLTKMNKETFEWVVQDVLTEQMQYVSTPGNSERPGPRKPEVDRFWAGVVLIVDKLDKELITHSLRGLEVSPDLFNLALGQLGCWSEETVESIINALVMLIERAPEAFWSAYGAVSPSTVAEQFFNSPMLPNLLQRAENQNTVDEEALVATKWIAPFVKSLPAAQQNEACRSMMNALFSKFQTEATPAKARMACLLGGLKTLEIILDSYTAEDYQINTGTSFVMINSALQLVDEYKDVIVGMAVMNKEREEEKGLCQAALKVIRGALYLDCTALKAEFLALERGRRVDHGLDSHSESLWSAVMDSFRPDDMGLAQSVLRGITPLIGLEDFLASKNHDLSSGKIKFNARFGQLTEIVANVFQRITDFKPENMRALYQNPECSRPLFGGLASAHGDTYASAVQLLKVLASEETRKDAIGVVLNSHMKNFLSDLVFAANRITQFRTFAAVPNLLKTGRDVLEGLCDTQNGVLRSKSTYVEAEQDALQNWWAEQWKAIENAFRMVEQWSDYHSLEDLKNFCRDVMEYAEKLFDQNMVIAKGLSVRPTDRVSAHSINETKVQADVLESPCSSATSLTKWLRLKDPHLAKTCVSVLTKMLRRLGRFNMEVSSYAFNTIDQVCKGVIKTILQAQDKIELKKALEENFGVEQMEEKPEIFKKQSTIEASFGRQPAAANKPKTSHVDPYRPSTQQPRAGLDKVDPYRPRPPVSTADSHVSKPMAGMSMRDDIRSLSSSVDQNKSTLEQMRQRQKLQQQKLRVEPRKESLKESRQREKDEKARRDAIAIAKAKALRDTVVRGEGSGIAGLGGIVGKDHAPVKSAMMVSSDEDESDDDDSDTGEDAMALIRKAKGNKNLSEFEKARRAAAKQPQGPVKKTKIIRSAKDMRARLTPDMRALHSIILKWDIFHQGDTPPCDLNCSTVPAQFQTYVDYQNLFYPLLVAEAWKSLSTERDQTTGDAFDINIVNRMSVDSFYEVSTTMQHGDNKKVQISDGDIVIFSKGQNPLKDKTMAHCLARVTGINRKKEFIEVIYRLSLDALKGPDNLGLNPNTKIRAFKLTTMTSIEREYAAMKSLQYYDLCDEILEGKPSPLQNYNSNVLVPLQRTYGLNSGQAKAIWSAKENDAFTLIQGPPGSGKTKTIVAMIGALLTGQIQPAPQGVAISRPGMPPPRQPVKQSGAPISKKLLVCAPSNAAVDELVSRLMAGVTDLKGQKQKINVIRLGRVDKINAAIKEVTLDGLVEKRMEADRASGNPHVSEKQKLHDQAGKLKAEIAELRPKLEAAREAKDKTTELRIQREIDGRKRDQARIGAKIDEDRDSGNTAARDNEINRRRIQQEIINGAHVLCSTLSGSGHDMFKNLNVEFETVIIDEAAQSIEISSLIPLKYGCNKCILVGDPKQLPPTVLSKMGARFGYEKSLFVRMQENHPDRVHLLDTQYRMHPEISHFPSKSFYDGKLIDGEGLATLRTKPWHSKELLAPYNFFDVKGMSSRAGTSLVNTAEIDVALQLFHRLRTEFSTYDFKNKIGIITPYKGQLRALRDALTRKFGEEILDVVDTNTTDAYQGREAEIIIFSCVRASTTSIGFLDDIRRMNVGLTRAKSSMWVLGDSNALKAGEYWRKLIGDAQERGRYTSGNVLDMLKRPLAAATTYSHMPDVVMEEADKPKHPVKRDLFEDVAMDDARPAIRKKPSSANIGSASSTSKSVSNASTIKNSNGHTPQMRSGNVNPNNKPNTNGMPARQAMPKLTAVTDDKPHPEKRAREESPSQEAQAPPRKVIRFLRNCFNRQRLTWKQIPAIPGLRIPGQPKPIGGAAGPIGRPVSSLFPRCGSFY